MAILNPEHLLSQAERLSRTATGGVPRQTDLRRAVSAAYYSLFHCIAAALGDEFVGVSQRRTSRYALAYRSLDHRLFRQTCEDMVKQVAPRKYRPYLPAAGVGSSLKQFASLAIDLQELRHSADYDPLRDFRTSDALAAIETARTALRAFSNATIEQRKLFLTLLLCPPR